LNSKEVGNDSNHSRFADGDDHRPNGELQTAMGRGGARTTEEAGPAAPKKAVRFAFWRLNLLDAPALSPFGGLTERVNNAAACVVPNFGWHIAPAIYPM
jgi:hypothetical protein